MTEAEWLVSSDPRAMLAYLCDGTEAWRHRNGASDRKLRLFACAVVRQLWDRLDDDQRVRVVFAEKEPFVQGALGGIHAAYLSRDALAEYTRNIVPERCVAFACGWLNAASAREVAEQAPAWIQRLATLSGQAALLREVVGNPHRPVSLPYQQDCSPRCNVRWHGKAPLRFDYRAGETKPRCGGCERDWVCPWLTPTVVSLAEAAYEQREGAGHLDPVRLAVLADCLEEAGCVGTRRWLCNEQGKHNHQGRAGQVIHGVLHESDPQAMHHHHDEKCPRIDPPHPIAAHLRSPGPHVRGAWSLDILLGKS